MSSITTLIKSVLFKILPAKQYQKKLISKKIQDIQQRKYDEAEIFFCSRMVPENGVIIDVGANYGHFTAQSALDLPHASVYAFEPIPYTFEVLKGVVDHFGFKHVHLFPYGVSDFADKKQFTVPKQSFGAYDIGLSHITGRNVASDKQFEVVDVETISLDEFLMPKINRVDMIKVDVEGAEPFVLLGAIKTIETYKPVLMLEVSSLLLDGFGYSRGFIDDYFKSRDYSFYKLVSDKLVHSESLGSDANFFFIPNEKTADFKHLMA